MEKAYESAQASIDSSSKKEVDAVKEIGEKLEKEAKEAQNAKNLKVT